MDSELHTLFPKRFLQGRRLGYLAIADTLARAILSSGLRGWQLPAQRAVAKHLGVAIATVSHAYSELEHRGLTRSRPGVGTYVCNFQNSDFIKDEVAVHEAVIDLTVSRPPVEGAARCFAHALAAISSKRNLCDLLGFEPANGWRHHRAAVAAWVSSRGYPIKANQVIACNGVQHALSVIFGSLTRPGDIIVTEELNYPGIKLLADTYRIRLLGIPMDGEGMRTDALEKI